MKILVCIKQILISDPVPDRSKKWVTTEGQASYAMNRFDENALEEAISIRERIGGDTTVDVISVGSESSSAVIRRGMGMGADNGIHLITDDSGYTDAATTAARMASFLTLSDSHYEMAADLDEKEDKPDIYGAGYDLILTGIMSEDLMQAQVGPILSEYLKIPCITSVVETSLNETLTEITVKRELEGGGRQQVRAELPALITIQAGINQPRYPTLSNILKANKKEILSFNAEDLSISKKDFKHTQVKVSEIRYPVKTRSGYMLEGAVSEKASQLIDILNQRGVM